MQFILLMYQMMSHSLIPLLLQNLNKGLDLTLPYNQLCHSLYHAMKIVGLRRFHKLVWLAFPNRLNFFFHTLAVPSPVYRPCHGKEQDKVSLFEVHLYAGFTTLLEMGGWNTLIKTMLQATLNWMSFQILVMWPTWTLTLVIAVIQEVQGSSLEVWKRNHWWTRSHVSLLVSDSQLFSKNWFNCTIECDIIF